MRGSSSREAVELLVAAFVAAAVIAGPASLIGLFTGVLSPLGFVGGVLAGSIVGYVVHELAHRFVGRRYGCTAYFRLWGFGLMATLASLIARSLGLGFAIIVPGYVAVACPWRGEPFLLALAGPASNVVLAGLGLLVALSGLYAWGIGFAYINAWIAFFNALPIPPLDGYTLFRERPVAWLLVFAVSLALLYVVQSL